MRRYEYFAHCYLYPIDDEWANYNLKDVLLS
ncbi:hypothetical protein GZOEXZXM_CDS0121 [Salmonella phage SeKF_64]